MKYSKADKENAREFLLKVLRPGKIVYTVLRHRSQSGMTKRLTLLTAYDSHEIADITQHVAILLDDPIKDDHLVVRGVGTDVGFDVVYRLSDALFGDGYALNHRWIY